MWNNEKKHKKSCKLRLRTKKLIYIEPKVEQKPSNQIKKKSLLMRKKMILYLDD